MMCGQTCFCIPYECKALDENFCIRKEDYFGENGGIIFPNPNAPTGVELPLSDIEEILQHNQDVIVIVDEGICRLRRQISAGAHRQI